MGYPTMHSMDSVLTHEIDFESKKLYAKRYGKRNPNTLSSRELEVIRHDAAIRVQDRRKGRLVE